MTQEIKMGNTFVSIFASAGLVCFSFHRRRLLPEDTFAVTPVFRSLQVIVI